MCVYIHTCIHTCAHTHTNTHARTHARARARTHTHTHIHTFNIFQLQFEKLIRNVTIYFQISSCPLESKRFSGFLALETDRTHIVLLITTLPASIDTDGRTTKYRYLLSYKLFGANEASFEQRTPNVVVERLTLLLRIRVVPGPNLGPKTGYIDWRFSLFSSVPPRELRDSTYLKIRQRPLPSISLPIHNLRITLSFNTIYSLTEKASLNYKSWYVHKRVRFPDCQM
jgi:hypothetical protein